MEALALQTGTAEQVRFVGAVDDTDKWRFLAGARLLVLPSYNENFGIVVLEAMAAGCPVVVTPEVGLAATVRESGAGLVVAGERRALAHAMASLLADDDLRARMGEIGRRVAREEFLLAGHRPAMDEVYRTCVGQWVAADTAIAGEGVTEYGNGTVSSGHGRRRLYRQPRVQGAGEGGLPACRLRQSGLWP